MRERYTPEQFLTAIENSGGILNTVAQRMGCDWHTVERYVKKYPELAAAVRAEKESLLDLAESVVKKALDDDDHIMARWVLSTLGKRRGWTQSLEINANPVDVNHVHTISVREIVEDTPQLPAPETLVLPEPEKEEPLPEPTGPLAEVIAKFREMQENGTGD